LSPLSWVISGMLYCAETLSIQTVRPAAYDTLLITSYQQPFISKAGRILIVHIDRAFLLLYEYLQLEESVPARRYANAMGESHQDLAFRHGKLRPTRTKTCQERFVRLLGRL
jgi:hypothetical protein